MKEDKWIGAKVKRFEDPRFLTGRGNYIGDINCPNQLHAAILRSPHAHAKIKNIDYSDALKLPGVFGGLTGVDVANMSDPIMTLVTVPMKYYCMAFNKVRYVGEPVVAIAAENRYIAEDALDLIKVEYEPLTPVMDSEKAMEKDAPLLHEEAGSNLCWHDTFPYGDIDEAFKKADEIIKERFTFHSYSSTPMETMGCIGNYNPAEGSFTAWSTMHVPMLFHMALAMALRVVGSKLRLIVPDVGGGFGNKAKVYPYVVLACLLSRKVGRPVKWIEDRRENLMACVQPPGRIAEYEVAVKKDGTILGIKEKLIDDVGAYTRLPEPNHMMRPFQTLVGCYKIPAIEIDGYIVNTNKCPSGANRGLGLQQYYFPLERIIDIIAKRLGMDPVDIRFKNFIQPSEFPYTTPNGSIYDSGDYPNTLKKILEMIDYKGFRKEQEKLRKEGIYRGIGIVTIVEPGGVNVGLLSMSLGIPILSGADDHAFVRVDNTGGVTILLGCPSMGTGLLTAAAQVAADILDVNPENINVISQYDSSTHPWSTGTHGSRFACSMAEAVAGAARIVRNKALMVASGMLEANIDDLDIKEGLIFVKSVPEKAIPLARVATIINISTALLPPGFEPGLEARYAFRFDKADLADEKRRMNMAVTYANSAHAAIIEVDMETGEVKVLKYIVLSDAGTMINPMIVDGQIHGGVIHGFGGTFLEEFIYDENGQQLTTTFLDYLLPKAPDSPDIQIEHTITPSPFTSLGAKGMGEGGAVPVPALMANAIEDALSPFSVKIRDSRMNIEKVWTMANKS